jgi:hypothetical protein
MNDKRSSAGQDVELPARSEVFFQISLRVVKGHLVLLQQRVDLEPHREPEKTLHLPLGQGTCPVTLHSDGFQGVAGHVSPLPCKGLLICLPVG